MESAPEIVVLIHGLWMNGTESSLLRHRLANEHGYPTVLFQYSTFEAGLAANSARLREFLDQQSASRVHLVGHSLGGVLALYTLERSPYPKPGRVVCLGSPLRGSLAADRLARFEFGAALLGSMGRDSLLTQVLVDYRGDRDVGVIAGTMSVGAGQILGALPEPNDGTVALVETELPGVRAHLSLPVSHTGLLVSPDVAAQTAFFLRHGLFNRAAAASRSA